MRISLCNEVIADLPFERQCTLARRLGYDGLEIAPCTLSEEPDRMPPARRAEIRRIAADAGIPITGLHYLLVAPKGLSITTKDAAVRRRTIDFMRALCELAAELGAKLLVHGSPAQRQLESGDEAESAKRGIDAFAAVASVAEAAGLTYLVEPLARDQTGFINTVEQAAAVVRSINSPALRTMVDCCAAGRTEATAIPELLRQWLPTGLVAHIHLNDPNRRAPGEGDLNFAPIFAALKDSKYSAIASVEPFIYEPDGPTCAARAIGYVRGVMQATMGRGAAVLPRL